MKRMIRLIVMLLFTILLLGLLFSYAMFEGGFVSWFLFYSFTPVFLYEIAFFFYPLKKWRMTRQFHRHVVHSGEELYVTIRMDRTFPFPLYYTIFEDIFPQSLQKVNLQHDTYRYLNSPKDLHVTRKLKHVVFPWFRRYIEKTYAIQEIPRGRHQFGEIRVRISDMFGFIHKEHVFPIEDELLVAPTTRQVQMSGRVSAFDHGEESAYSFRLKNTNIAIGTREYVPGDKFSWIDWKQTAKKNELMTKEFEQEKSTDTMIVLNACHHNGYNQLAFEAAVEVAFSMIEMIHGQASKTDFISIGEKNTYIPLYQDETKAVDLREHLTVIEPYGKGSFAETLTQTMVNRSRGYVTILITTMIDDRFQEAVSQMASRMKRIIVMLIQGSRWIADVEYALIRQMESSGVVVNVLTEKELIHHTVEVNVV